MHVDGLGFAHETRTPGAGKNLISAQGHAFVFNKYPEQVEFARSHLELAACNLSAPRRGVETQTANLSDRVHSPE